MINQNNIIYDHKDEIFASDEFGTDEFDDSSAISLYPYLAKIQFKNENQHLRFRNDLMFLVMTSD